MNKLRDFFSACNRLQQSRLFKIIASCLIIIAGISSCIAYSVAVSAASQSLLTAEDAPRQLSAEELEALGEGKDIDPQKQLSANQLDASAKVINDILGGKQSITGFIIGACVVSLLALVVVWIGLGLTYLGYALIGTVLVLFFSLIGRGQDLGIAAGGLVGLFAAFSALLQGARLLLIGSHPVLAIARNVLIEAVRMRISLVFIVLVVFGLSALPLALDPASPLRYRVQSFLQYATAGCFWTIALLVLVFSISSIALEQREKTIWQTVTKPVAPWQYILGKWLGVVTLAAALLLTTCSGVFLFTEYLRSQRAIGESDSYVTRGGRGITEDRLILETQVLTARTSVRPSPIELDEEVFNKNVGDKVEAEMRNIEQATNDPDQMRLRRESLRTTIADSLRKSVELQYRSIDPGAAQEYVFEGLQAAKDSGRPLVLRFKFDSGANRPDAEFKVTLQFAHAEPRVVPIGLGQFSSIPFAPVVIEKDGIVALRIINGDIGTGRMNSEAIHFAPDGLEVSYTSGSFRGNFFRVVGVLWIKLAFLAMLAIAAGTFLSFSVASIVALGIFLAAEGAGFVAGALENYPTDDGRGNTLIFPSIIATIGGIVSSILKPYADLRPTARLVEGLELSFHDFVTGGLVLVAATVVLYVFAVYVFRKRELAMYSGN